ALRLRDGGAAVHAGLRQCRDDARFELVPGPAGRDRRLAGGSGDPAARHGGPRHPALGPGGNLLDGGRVFGPVHAVTTPVECPEGGFPCHRLICSDARAGRHVRPATPRDRRPRPVTPPLSRAAPRIATTPYPS